MNGIYGLISLNIEGEMINLLNIGAELNRFFKI